MALKYIKDVATIKLDVDKCIGCKLCSTVCPHNVIVIEDKKAKIVDKNSCIECGACMKNCPTGALWVRSGVG